MKLLIATPAIDGQFCGEYIGSLIQTLSLCQQRRIQVEWFFCRGISEISRGRDSIASYALRGEFDKLLFIDADEGWRPEAVAALLDSGHEIVGGTYAKKEFPLNLNFGCLPQHTSYFPGGLKTPEAYAKWSAECADERGEVEIAFLPTGFMLIDCSVFRRMQDDAPPYLSKDAASGEEVRCWEFFPIGVIGGHKDTEDWGFCRFAQGCGFRTYLQTRAIADHIGRHNFRMQPEVQL